jgi:hypothetical protein
MKSIFKKINLLGVAALIIGATAAFTTAGTEKPAAVADEVWFNYTSESQDPADLQNLDNYSLAGQTQPACEGTAKRCAIEAQRSADDPMKPDLSTITSEVKKP